DHLSPQGSRRVAAVIAESALLRRAPPACRVPAEAAVARLGTALSDADPEVRRCAARALGRPGSAAPGAVRFLEPALRDPAESVRREAVHALGQMGEASR